MKAEIYFLCIYSWQNNQVGRIGLIGTDLEGTFSVSAGFKTAPLTGSRLALVVSLWANELNEAKRGLFVKMDRSVPEQCDWTWGLRLPAVQKRRHVARREPNGPVSSHVWVKVPVGEATRVATVRGRHGGVRADSRPHHTNWTVAVIVRHPTDAFVHLF